MRDKLKTDKSHLQSPPLNLLKSFDCIARKQSFKAAADELNITPAAISQQVTKLEQYLGFELFVRHGRNTELTRQGLKYHEDIASALSTLTRATQEAARRGNAQSLKISCVPMLLNYVLLPHLSEFTQQHPTIQIDIDSSIDYVDFRKNDFDLAIRFNRDQNKHLQHEKLCNVFVCPVANAGFSKNNNKHQRVIEFKHDKATWDLWRRKWKQTLAIESNLQLDNFTSIITVLTQTQPPSQAIVMGYFPVLSPLIASGELTFPFGFKPLRVGSAYLVYPKEKQHNALIREFSVWFNTVLLPYT